MDINCPNCTTHFTVPDDVIGPSGRKLKCSQCGHVWRHMPGTAPALQSAGAADQTAAPQPTSPNPSSDRVPMEMEPAPGSARADDDPAPSVAGNAKDDAAADALDDDPLAGLDFGDSDKDDDFTAFSDLGNADDGDPADLDLDDILSQDAEPIPGMFAEDPAPPADTAKGKAVKATLLALLVVLALIGAGGWFGRTHVVQAFPQSQVVYDSLGIPVNALGLGLMFRDVTTERLAHNGADVLVVRGFIANTSDDPRPVPFLHLALFDATDALVQDVVAEPPTRELGPRERTGFRVQLENPSAAARRFEVDWTEPPTGGGAQHGDTAPASQD